MRTFSMHYSFVQSSLRRCAYNGSRISATGHVTQVRNHVKMYPWRENRTNSECYLDTTKTPYTDKHNVNEFLPKKFQRKPWMKVVYKDKDSRFYRYQSHEAYTSDPVEAKETAISRLNRFVQSAKDRGHARYTKSYSPPDSVRDKIFSIFNDLYSSLSSQDNPSPGSILARVMDEDSILNFDLNQSRDFKYHIITRCVDEFKYDLSSATLNDIATVADLIDYYSTPVRGIDPYSSLVERNESLPPNLTILSDALRFDKDTDQYFGGQTALPGIVNEVPGLRGRKKYERLNQDEFQWPDI